MSCLKSNYAVIIHYGRSFICSIIKNISDLNDLLVLRRLNFTSTLKCLLKYCRWSCSPTLLGEQLLRVLTGIWIIWDNLLDTDMNGICTLANDKVYDQLVALLNSIEAIAPSQTPVCLYPFDDRTERIAAEIVKCPNVFIYEDKESIERWDRCMLEAAPDRLNKSKFRLYGAHRRFCAFDNFIYMDNLYGCRWTTVAQLHGDAIAEARQIILHKLNLLNWLSNFVNQFS